MRAKEYLKQLDWIEDEIKLLKLEYEKVSSSLLGAVRLKEIDVQSSPVDKMDDTYIILFEYSQRLSRKQEELFKKKVEISEQIDLVKDDKCRQLLKYRYVIGFDWKKIADIMRYNTRYIYKLHGKALQEFSKIMKEDTKRH
ncbi:DUF1492 domain-containing protein [Ignavigranum ruoffiae]|uniref:DUF1492 domain-containing protein n=1 Tax=Ignavigranum ruoffiae TaxID=89093 RepID=UPI0023566517|nr:DUF1492 domain-containing protein [Ignavigranum ruoffiae]